MRGIPFKSNDPRINRKGRPVGSIDHRWHDVKWWFNLISENYEKLTPREKVDAGLRGITLLISKMQNLPKDPEESLHRAKTKQEAEEELTQAESNVNAES